MYILKGKKRLRYGYTTGTCAQAAVQAATSMLLTGEKVLEVNILTSRGISFDIEIKEIKQREKFVSCAVQKDSGDDPDVTNGMLVYASVEKRQDGQIVIKGGNGIGKVTKPGLKVPVGEYAINPAPKEVIRHTVEKEVVQLNVSKSHQLGNYNVMKPHNPIYIISFIGGLNE